jgi:hypothetical protein
VHRRTIRHYLILAIASLHAAVMLLGPCLHALPGGRHAPRPALAADHGHRAVEHSPVTHSPVSHRSADDCPVCHFLAQGQLPVETASGPVSQTVAELGPLHPLRLPSRSRHTFFCPRAPPAPAFA